MPVVVQTHSCSQKGTPRWTFGFEKLPSLFGISQFLEEVVPFCLIPSCLEYQTWLSLLKQREREKNRAGIHQMAQMQSQACFSLAFPTSEERRYSFLSFGPGITYFVQTRDRIGMERNKTDRLFLCVFYDEAAFHLTVRCLHALLLFHFVAANNTALEGNLTSLHTIIIVLTFLFVVGYMPT